MAYKEWLPRGSRFRGVTETRYTPPLKVKHEFCPQELNELHRKDDK